MLKILAVYLILMAAPGYEAPQIWGVDGVSLAYSRLQIEQVLGRSPRPVKHGANWEYTYRNGLKAAFVDQDLGRHPRLLVGKHLTSRGLELVRVGQTRQAVAELLGTPSFESPESCVYYDSDRQAYLTLSFKSGRLTAGALSREI